MANKANKAPGSEPRVVQELETRILELYFHARSVNGDSDVGFGGVPRKALDVEGVRKPTHAAKKAGHG